MPTKYMLKRDRTGLSKSIKGKEKTLKDPYLRMGLDSPTRMENAMFSELKQLKEGTPAPIETDKERESVEKFQSTNVEAMREGNSEIPAMPTRREMQDNPVGSTGKHMRWEKHWKHHFVNSEGEVVRDPHGRGAIFRWKDNQQRLHPEREDEDIDLRNIEKFRKDNATPSGLPGNVPLMDSKIGVNYALAAKMTEEQWHKMWEGAQMMSATLEQVDDNKWVTKKDIPTSGKKKKKGKGKK
jgi:hypothetical protein